MSFNFIDFILSMVMVLDYSGGYCVVPALEEGRWGIEGPCAVAGVPHVGGWRKDLPVSS